MVVIGIRGTVVLGGGTRGELLLVVLEQPIRRTNENKAIFSKYDFNFHFLRTISPLATATFKSYTQFLNRNDGTRSHGSSVQSKYQFNRCL